MWERGFSPVRSGLVSKWLVFASSDTTAVRSFWCALHHIIPSFVHVAPVCSIGEFCDLTLCLSGLITVSPTAFISLEKKR